MDETDSTCSTVVTADHMKVVWNFQMHSSSRQDAQRRPHLLCKPACVAAPSL